MVCKSTYMYNQQIGILSAHARRESNCISSAPFVILNALSAGFQPAIYALKKILSREMRECSKITHFSINIVIRRVFLGVQMRIF